MGLLARLLGTEKVEQRAVYSWVGGGWSQNTYADIPVNETNALGISALWCGITVISETIGSLPLYLYERQEDDGKELARTNSLYNLFLKSPTRT